MDPFVEQVIGNVLAGSPLRHAAGQSAALDQGGAKGGSQAPSFDVHPPLPTTIAGTSDTRRACATFGVHPPLPTAGPDSSAESLSRSSGELPPRPNYQREHARGRLRVLELRGAQPSSAHPSAPVELARPTHPDVASSQSPAEVALRTRALAAAASAGGMSARPSSACAECHRPCACRLVSLELLEEPDRRLQRLLGVEVRKADSLLVATSVACSLCQIFAVDAAIGEAPGLHVDVSWSESQASPFRLTCAGPMDDLRRVRDSLERELATGGARMSREPSAWLRSKLHVPSGAILGADMAPARLACVLDEHWKDHSDSTVEVSACCGGTVVVGVADELEELASALRRVLPARA